MILREYKNAALREVDMGSSKGSGVFGKGRSSASVPVALEVR